MDGNLDERPALSDEDVANAFTVDVEEWFDGVHVDAQVRDSATSRLHGSLDRLLGLMDDSGAKGTFFWLGPLALRHPGLLRKIAAEGHEIGCHGWSHNFIHRMRPDQFRIETRAAQDAISQVIGKPITSYRAAYFSVNRKSLWAFEILAELGFTADSSIFPVANKPHNLSQFPLNPHYIDTPAGQILESPIATRSLGSTNLPASGGAYFRIYPYSVTRANFRAIERAGRSGVFYIHPWELDADHPAAGMNLRRRLTHCFNLGATIPRLQRLFAEFRFVPLKTIALQSQHAYRSIPIDSLWKDSPPKPSTRPAMANLRYPA